VVFTPEYENPDGDASEQDDSRHEPPPALYRAEDVLNAQDSSSALKNRGEDPADPHTIRPTAIPATGPGAALAAANLASLPN
jgi:hypothetical protein